MKIVSACLAGITCAYHGKDKSCKKVIDMVKNGEVILVCPEQLGGLPTPRDRAEIQGDKVVTIHGNDVTEQFERGATEALKIAQMAGCTEAILKAKSPSCGCGTIYDGTFSNTLTKGDGIFATKCKENGITVTTEDEL